MVMLRQPSPRFSQILHFKIHNSTKTIKLKSSCVQTYVCSVIWLCNVKSQSIYLLTPVDFNMQPVDWQNFLALEAEALFVVIVVTDVSFDASLFTETRSFCLFFGPIVNSTEKKQLMPLLCSECCCHQLLLLCCCLLSDRKRGKKTLFR